MSKISAHFTSSPVSLFDISQDQLFLKRDMDCLLTLLSVRYLYVHSMCVSVYYVVFSLFLLIKTGEIIFYENLYLYTV